MIAPADRRTVLRLAAAAAVLLPAFPARAAARFAPPAAPMRYIRRLERDLGGGATFTVERGFEVRFVPAGTGFRVEGTQASVNVAAPDSLAGFARLERERVEAALFPLTLDAAGTIVGGAGRQPAAQLDEAVREAASMIEARPQDAAGRGAALRFLGALHQSAGRVLTELPPDLFAPPADPRIERRAVALPGGETGAITVRFTATADPATGLMREAMREVVTELAGGSRRTTESWRLALA